MKMHTRNFIYGSVNSTSPLGTRSISLENDTSHYSEVLLQ